MTAIFIIQMRRVQQSEFDDKDSRQLITILKNIIASQELKIAELEKDLKKWQKKYKDEFFKEKNNNNKHYQKNAESDLLILNFSKQLFLLQNKYDKRAANSYGVTPTQSLREGLDLIEQLYTRLGSKLQEIKQINIVIEQQAQQIEQSKHKMEAYLKQFALTVKKSQEYQQKLFAQIKKLQQQKIKVKQ